MIIKQITEVLNSITSRITVLKKEYKAISYILDQFKVLLKQNGSTDEDVKDNNILNTLAKKLQQASEGDTDVIIKKYLNYELAVDVTIPNNFNIPPYYLARASIKTLRYDGATLPLTDIAQYASVNTVDMPNLTTMQGQFLQGGKVKELKLPNLQKASGLLVYAQEAPETIYLPKLEQLDYNGMYNNSATKFVILPKIKMLYEDAFLGMKRVELIYLGGGLPRAIGTRIQGSYGIELKPVYVVLTQPNPPDVYDVYNIANHNKLTYNRKTYFVVPDSSKESYKSATLWSTISEYIIGRSELPAQYESILQQYGLGV